MPGGSQSGVGQSAPIRVLFLDHTAKLSGGEIALLRLLPHLDRCESFALLGEDGPLVGRLEQLGVPARVLPISMQAKDLRKDAVVPGLAILRPAFTTLRYAIQVSRFVRRTRPDVIHANSLKSGVYGSIAGRLSGVPVVWHVRDRIADDYLPRPAVALVRLLLRSLPHEVLVNSEATLRTIGSKAPATLEQSVVSEIAEFKAIPNGTLRAEARAFGIVGRLAPWKGQDVFLRAFADAFGGGDERGIIVGAAMFGEDAYAESLKRLVAELEIEDRVEFRGFREDVAAELRRMDVLVHASVTDEPFGQVVLEGLAAGLPVIASAGGGPREIITDGVDGLLHPPGDIEALSTQLRRLRDDTALRERLVEAGGRRVMAFGPEIARDRVQAAYRRALGR